MEKQLGFGPEIAFIMNPGPTNIILGIIRNAVDRMYFTLSLQ